MSGERLVRLPHLTAPDSVEDFALTVMAAWEDAMLSAGASPGTDYTYRDLASWAAPLVAATWVSPVAKLGKLMTLSDGALVSRGEHQKVTQSHQSPVRVLAARRSVE